MKEIWKDIEGYEGLFLISNFGRIKAMPRSKRNRSGVYMTKMRIYNPKTLNNYGYFVVGLNGKTHLLHRIIAKAFVPNTNKLPIINHKNGIKTDNNINNIEWCSYAHNNKHAYDSGLKVGSRTGKFDIDNVSSKPVYHIDLTGKIISIFGSASEAARQTGFDQSCISRCARGERKTYKGYKWSYNTIDNG